jgi:hypothetical protein
MASQLNYSASPTVARFMKSAAFGRLIAGPVGSGKTVGCVIELLRRSIGQAKAKDGYRYTRWAIVRQTLKQLKDTVLKDCQQWLQGLGTWKVSENTFYLEFGDVRSELVFIPLENAEDQARLLSMQLTGAWMSEAIEMDVDVLGPLSGRLGRYPSGDKGAPTWFGWIADTNFPTEMTPWHELMENPPMGVQIFKQPSGLSPEAENLNWLTQTEDTVKLPIDDPQRLKQGRTYYERFVEQFGEDSDWVRRYVKAEYGDDPSGAAVFKNTFKSDFHIVDDTLVIPGYTLLIGQDFGRNPWSLIAQMDHMGRLLVHEEVPATNIGLEKHVNEHLRPRLYQPRYVGMRVACVGDPSGIAKGSIGEESCFDALNRLGLPGFPAPTNDIEPRLRAVEALLGRQINAGPALVISRKGCPHLCRAMSGGYRFTKMKTGALRTVPDKTDKEGYSHVADDLQYLALVVHGGIVPEISRRLRPRTRKRAAVSAAGWT